MSESKVERLELEALQERNEIHRSVTELKSQVSHVREKLDPARNAREHFLVASMVATAAGLVAGFGFGGFFAGERERGRFILPRAVTDKLCGLVQ